MPKHKFAGLRRAILLAGVATVFLTPVEAQTYNYFIMPQHSDTRWAYCQDIYTHQYLYWCSLELYTLYYPMTNAHLHESSSHPWSTLECTDSDQCTPSAGQDIYANTTWRGSIEHRVATTLVGQAERECVYTYGSTRCYDHVAGYNDVYYNNHEEIWLRIGGDETGGGTGHGSTYYNRYMMTNPAYGLYYATYDYLADHPGQEKVCTNDMALPFGGKFDINQNWASPHTAHDRGTAADVAGPGGSQCPAAYQVNVDEFLEDCRNHGALSAYSIPEGNHAHANFANPYSYPH